MKTAFLTAALFALVVTIFTGCGGGIEAPVTDAGTISAETIAYGGEWTPLVSDAPRHFSGRPGFYNFTVIQTAAGENSPVVVETEDGTPIQPFGKGFLLQLGDYKLKSLGMEPWHLSIVESEFEDRVLRAKFFNDNGTECYRNERGIYELSLGVPVNIREDWVTATGAWSWPPDHGYTCGYWTMIGTDGYSTAGTFRIIPSKVGEFVFGLRAGTDFNNPNWTAVVGAIVGRG